MAEPVPPATGATPAEAAAPAVQRRWDPAILPIVAAAVVLAAAIGWLLFSPRPEPAKPGAGQTAARIEALEQRLAMDQDALAALGDRVAAAEAAAQQAAARPDAAAEAVAALNTRLSAAETLARSTAARLPGDPAALAAIGERLTAVTNRLQGLEAADGAANTRLGQITDRVTEAERALARIATLDQRLTAVETALPARIGAVETMIGSRASALESSLTARIAASEQAAQQRVAGLESMLTARLAEAQAATTRLEARLARLAGAEGLRRALAEGRPLQPALAGIAQPPAALQRYATEAPPTEAALRLRFEDAARAARAAVETGGHGSPLEAATSRLAGLITIRRGEQVVWGDDSAAALERARVALAAGDLTEALSRVAALPPAAQAAMAPWVAEAEALRAAREAIATLAEG